MYPSGGSGNTFGLKRNIFSAISGNKKTDYSSNLKKRRSQIKSEQQNNRRNKQNMMSNSFAGAGNRFLDHQNGQMTEKKDKQLYEMSSAEFLKDVHINQNLINESKQIVNNMRPFTQGVRLRTSQNFHKHSQNSQGEEGNNYLSEYENQLNVKNKGNSLIYTPLKQ